LTTPGLEERAHNRLARMMPLAVVGCASGLAALAIVRERDEIAGALARLSWWATPLSGVAGLVAVLGIYRSWAVMVRACGIELEPWQAFRVFAVGQAGKYVPGSVWSVVTPAQMVRQYGGSRSRMAAATLVALLVSVCVALVLGCVLLPASGGRASRALWFAPILAVPVAVTLVPPVLNRLVRTAGRLLRRGPVDSAISASAVLASAAWAAAADFCFGVHLQLLGTNMGATGFDGFLICTCAYSLAAALGVLVFFAPAGAGVREVVITLVLAPKLTVAAGLVVALLSRVVMTVVDLALALSRIRPGETDRERQPVFITRRFPPSVGGMETLASGVWQAIHAMRPDAVLLAHGRSNKSLAWWLPLAWTRLALLLLRGRVAFVLAGDAPTYAVMSPLIRLARVPGIVMVLGLDLTHPSPAYQRLVVRRVRGASRVIAISGATRDAAVVAGVPADRVGVMRLGTPAPVGPTGREAAQIAVRRRLGLEQTDVVILTLGRLVRRKGVCWFVEEVVPSLAVNVHYVVAGDGPDAPSIEESIQREGLAGRVHMMGRVSNDDRDLLMCGCDVFVQPNIAVPGDMEGFGLVTIEAAMRGAVVVAADLEGLKDAVIDQHTGLLLPSGDASLWVSTLGSLVGDFASRAAMGARFQQAAANEFGEERMAQALRDVLGLSPAAEHPQSDS
jgi:glycosyltransferase involved in cell wall biosynthesis